MHFDATATRWHFIQIGNGNRVFSRLVTGIGTVFQEKADRGVGVKVVTCTLQCGQREVERRITVVGDNIGDTCCGGWRDIGCAGNTAFGDSKVDNTVFNKADGR